MDRTQGYPLPDGELGNDDIACTVVFYPDRAEYRAALQGSLAYLATWIAWQKDADKRGKDAADDWRVAYEMTTECWQMGCFEQLTDDVAAILLLLQNVDPCCSESITYNTTTIITTTITPGVGDPPDDYGETAVADWDEWYEHVCFQAHAYVDRLIHYGETVAALFAAGGLTLGAWAEIWSSLQFMGLPIPFYIADIMEWLSDFLSDAGSSWFDDVASDLESSRTAIVCSILEEGDLESAVEDAIDTAPWNLFYQFINYDGIQALIYEGGYDGEYLVTETKDDCDQCDYQPLGPEEYFMEIVQGSDEGYDEDTKVHTIGYTSSGGCEIASYQIWEDDTMVTKLPVRVQIISCGAGTCGGVYQHRTFVGVAQTPVYSLDHPSDMGVGAGIHDHGWIVHDGAFDVSFRIYETGA